MIAAGVAVGVATGAVARVGVVGVGGRVLRVGDDDGLAGIMRSVVSLSYPQRHLLHGHLSDAFIQSDSR